MPDRLSDGGKPMVVLSREKPPRTRVTKGASPPADRKGSKRRCIPNACIPCRKRKSKCDGGTPTCSTCNAVYNTPCSYESTPEPRKSAPRKDESTGSPERADVDVEAHWNPTDLHGLFLPESVLDHAARDATREQQISAPRRSSDAWTAVTADMYFVQHALDRYFANSFYTLLLQDRFIQDFRSGATTHCSAILVNALCAYGCHFGEPGQTDYETAGDHFFNEARRALFDDETARLTTVQALAVMGLGQAALGKEDSAFQYIGRAMRMAVDLGLHLPLRVAHSVAPALNDALACKTTFWGCYCLDVSLSFWFTRPPQLSPSAIGLDRVVASFSPSSSPTRGPRSPSNGPAGPELVFLNSLSHLCDLVNESASLLFNSQGRLPASRLLEQFKRFQDWIRELPDALRYHEHAIPPVCVLHMLCMSAMITINRPLLNIASPPPSSPQGVDYKHLSLNTATELAAMALRFREQFSHLTFPPLLPHILVSTASTFLIDPSPGPQLASLFRELNAMSATEPTALNALHRLQSLAAAHSIRLPDVPTPSLHVAPQSARLTTPHPRDPSTSPVAARPALTRSEHSAHSTGTAPRTPPDQQYYPGDMALPPLRQIAQPSLRPWSSVGPSPQHAAPSYGAVHRLPEPRIESGREMQGVQPDALSGDEMAGTYGSGYSKHVMDFSVRGSPVDVGGRNPGPRPSANRRGMDLKAMLSD